MGYARTLAMPADGVASAVCGPWLGMRRSRLVACAGPAQAIKRDNRDNPFHIFWNFSRFAPQIGQLAGASPNSMWPQTGQR